LRSDVAGKSTDIDFYVYDRSDQEKFLGHARMPLNLSEDNTEVDGWYKLEARDSRDETVTGEIHVHMKFQKTDKKTIGPEDFQILKLIGKGEYASKAGSCD
jgi:serine/threonine protein kinase SCH9